MNKKTLIIIAVVIVVIGISYYGINNWLKGRSLQQVFQDTTNGVATQPGLGTDTNGEAVETPENLYKETKAVSLSSKTLPFFTENVKIEIEKVFGESKVTAYGKYSWYEGSFEAELKVPRVIIPEDLTKLEEVYLKQGFETTENSVSADLGTLTMEKSDETEIGFSYYSFDNQNIRVRYIPVQAND